MSRFNALLFDLDGTLIDSRAAQTQYMRMMFAAADMRFPEEDAENFFTWDIRRLNDHYFSDPAVQPAIERFRREYDWADLFPQTSLMDGAQSALADLARDHRLGVVTNRGYTTPGILEWHGIREFFEVVISAIDVQPNKPHPAMIEAALQELGVTAADAIYIGDSPIDVETAENAGMPSLIVGDWVQGTRNARDLYSLPTMLRNWND